MKAQQPRGIAVFSPEHYYSPAKRIAAELVSIAREVSVRIPSDLWVTLALILSAYYFVGVVNV